MCAKRPIDAWLPPLAYAVLIFVQSSYPSPRMLPHFFGADKLLHFCGYGLMGLLLLRGFRLSNRQVGGREILWSIILTILYGISDEFHQHFVLSRTADVMDVVADALGGTCGIFLYGQLHRADFMARMKGKMR
jgi:VanZ family protein